ncbi:ANTAR domain-containing protein [Streptomyces sp. NPDC006012]|uniref:ANTAR domain-containing protein n=1 Tax=Streptomyces sp. NPDC006012 TaxID=3364739 RepID=UPI003689D2D7
MTSAHAYRTPPPDLVIEPSAEGDHTLVSVRGDLTLDSCQSLQKALTGALNSSATRVELDLSKVDHCDCSMLNILLNARREAQPRNKSITIVADGPAVERILALTDTRALFCHRQAAEVEVSITSAGRRRPETVDEDLRVELIQMQRALQTRPAIDLARGILMASFGLSADEAWQVLVDASQNTNTKVHRVAGEVVTTVGGAPLAGPLQRQLTTAVARVCAESRVTPRGRRSPVRRPKFR